MMRRRATVILGHPLCVVAFLLLAATALSIAVEHHPGIRRLTLFPAGFGGPVGRGVVGPKAMVFSYLHRTRDGSLMLSADDRLEVWPSFERHEKLGMVRIVHSPTDRTCRVEYPEGLPEHDKAEARRLLADAHFTSGWYGNINTSNEKAQFLRTGLFKSPWSAYDRTTPWWVKGALIPGGLAIACVGLFVSLIMLMRNHFRGVLALIGSPLMLVACVLALAMDWHALGRAQLFRDIDTTVGAWAMPRRSSVRITPHMDDLVLRRRPDRSFLVATLYDELQPGWRPIAPPEEQERVIVRPRQLATGFHAGITNELRLFVVGPYLPGGTAAADGRDAALRFYREHFDDGALITDADIRQARRDAAAGGTTSSPTVLRYRLGPRPLGYLHDATGIMVVVVLCAFLIVGPPRWARALRPGKPGHCPNCGYDLAGINASTCPECGAERRGIQDALTAEGRKMRT